MRYLHLTFGACSSGLIYSPIYGELEIKMHRLMLSDVSGVCMGLRHYWWPYEVVHIAK